MDRNTFIPGINDLVKGNAPMGVMSVSEKMQRGKTVRDLMADYKTAKQNNQIDKAKGIAGMFRDRTFIDNYFRYFGYSFIDKPEDVVPNVKLTFYTFHLMVILGFYFILLFIMSLYFLFRGTIRKEKVVLVDFALFHIITICRRRNRMGSYRNGSPSMDYPGPDACFNRCFPDRNRIGDNDFYPLRSSFHDFACC